MWSKKSKIIYCIIIALLIVFGIKIYQDKKMKSVKFTSHYNDLYYGLTYSDLDKPIKNFSDLELVTYDNNTKEKIKYQLEDIKFDTADTSINLQLTTIKSFDNWILLQGINTNNLYGIDVTTGNVKSFINKDNQNLIKTYALSDNQLIYTTLIGNSNNVTKTYKIEVININTNEIITIGTFNNSTDIPVSIYDNKASFLIENKITVVDISKNTTIATSEPNYSGASFIYKENIYSFTMETGSFVKLDLNMNEEELLKNANISNELYVDNDRIASSMYFYDTISEKMYVRNLTSNAITERDLLGDYILNNDSKYEKLEENLNYIEYTAKGDMFVGNKQNIDLKTTVRVLPSGEVIVTPTDSNEILKYYPGFTNTDKFHLWDFSYNNNKVYGIETNDNSIPCLVSIDLDTGEKALIKEISEPKENINQITAYDKEVGYLVQNDIETKLILINLDTKEETELKLNTNADIDELLFNEKYIVISEFDRGIIRIYGKYTGNILAVTRDNHYTIIGMTNEGIGVSSNSEPQYSILDFTLKIIKEYSDYDKVLKYLYK